MSAVQQYCDNNKGLIFTQSVSNIQPSYSFLLRYGKYLPAKAQLFQCPKADGLAYIKSQNHSTSNYSGRIYAGKDTYSGVENWQELAVCDTYSYTVNYKVRHHTRGPNNTYDNNKPYEKSIFGYTKKKVTDSNGNSNGGNDDARYVITGKIKSPSTFIFILDGKRQGFNAHHQTLWYTPKSWGANPWAAHGGEKANAGMLDGHVEFVDNYKLLSNLWGSQPEGKEAKIDWATE